MRKLLLASLFMLSSAAYAAFTYPLLVIDTMDTATLPAEFRTLNQPLPANNTFNSQGLASMQVAGSAQFSEKQLTAVTNKLHPVSLMIFDLRQEDHGFLNGNAISWYGINNQANLGKTGQQIEQDQFQRLNVLQNLPSTTLYQIASKGSDGSITSARPYTMTVNNVFAESDLTRAYSFGYTRIYVTDHMRPTDSQVDRFLTAYQALPASTWIYVHCRGGKGRTTTFLAMIDMLRNGKNVSFDDIIKRQAALGSTDLSKPFPATDINAQAALDRYQFLQDFYTYSTKAPAKMLWSAWLNQQKMNAMSKSIIKVNPSTTPVPSSNPPAVVAPVTSAPTTSTSSAASTGTTAATNNQVVTP